MIRVEITLQEMPRGLITRTRAVKKSPSPLELDLASLAENVSACAMKNAILLADGRAKLNVEGFLADLPRMVIEG